MTASKDAYLRMLGNIYEQNVTSRCSCVCICTYVLCEGTCRCRPVQDSDYEEIKW